MKKKCCFIIPYFGKLPNYFPMFLKSCEYNMDYNWIVLTDDNTNYNYPKNVKKIFYTLTNFKELCDSKFDFHVVINNPHKLCDFKPAYGYLFEEYLTGFSYWGYCDIDLIFGKLSDFIDDFMLMNYDKLFVLGHLSIYKNDYDACRLFMKKWNGKELYKESFQSERTTIFDEPYGNGKDNGCIYDIYKSLGKKILLDDFSMNANIKKINFIKTTFNPQTFEFDNEKYKDAVYIWENGKIFRYYIDKGNLKKEEFLYFHFQLRKMKIFCDVDNETIIKILGNGFYKLEVDGVTTQNFKKIKNKIYSFEYLKRNISWKVSGLKDRILKLFRK